MNPLDLVTEPLQYDFMLRALAATSLADTAVLLRRRLLFHGPVIEALEPAMLARAFGLDPLAAGGAAR